MGSDGHIRFYDQGKVDRISEEINHKYNLKGDHKIRFPGYKCPFTVNGQPCYVIYWDSNSRKEIIENPKGWRKAKKIMDSWHDWDFQYNKAELRIFKEFEERCNAEAILVEDQEVWT
jgi:hypothetical protein